MSRKIIFSLCLLLCGALIALNGEAALLDDSVGVVQLYHGVSGTVVHHRTREYPHFHIILPELDRKEAVTGMLLGDLGTIEKDATGVHG